MLKRLGCRIGFDELVNGPIQVAPLHTGRPGRPAARCRIGGAPPRRCAIAGNPPAGSHTRQVRTYVWIHEQLQHQGNVPVPADEPCYWSWQGGHVCGSIRPDRHLRSGGEAFAEKHGQVVGDQGT